MQTLEEMVKQVEGEKGILYGRFLGQMVGYIEKNNHVPNGSTVFIPMKLYYKIASWVFHLKKREARMLLGELKTLKIITFSRGPGKATGIRINVVIK